MLPLAELGFYITKDENFHQVLSHSFRLGCNLVSKYLFRPSKKIELSSLEDYQKNHEKIQQLVQTMDLIQKVIHSNPDLLKICNEKLRQDNKIANVPKVVLEDFDPLNPIDCVTQQNLHLNFLHHQIFEQKLFFARHQEVWIKFIESWHDFQNSNSSHENFKILKIDEFITIK